MGGGATRRAVKGPLSSHLEQVGGSRACLDLGVCMTISQSLEEELQEDDGIAKSAQRKPPNKVLRIYALPLRAPRVWTNLRT